MSLIFTLCFVVGIVALVGAFAVGEVADFGGGHADGLPFLSLTTLATALFGFGAGGLAAHLIGASTPLAVVVAVVVAGILVAVTRGLLMPYILRQQDNSHIGRTSYQGLLGTVTLTISPADWGEISFVDPDGNRVQAKAVSAQPIALTTGTTVYIADVDDQYLHVVTVDDAI
ncbi:membrane protein implicated in regulation of membrane protease activity [Rhodococcus sp. 27YEA15]|uniref:hypothetical protein n=1 Tax=Rhodococcus sp. 27YEA15 TaxID=3156259 RepID=UPI003C7EC40C